MLLKLFKTVKQFFVNLYYNKKPIFFIILISTVFSAIIPYYIFNRDGSSKTGNNQGVIDLTKEKAIALLRVEKRNILDKININGQITFFEKVSVSSKVSGRLEKINIQEGKKVTRMQVIAEVERLPLELSLKQQLAELKIARKSYELTKAKYENALKSVEIKLKTIGKAEISVNDKKTSFLNMKRTMRNKKKLFEIGGVSESDLESLKAKYTTLYSDYLHAKADLEIQKVGYRDKDIIAEGYQVPKSKKARLDLLKQINTKIERAELSAARSKIEQAQKNVESTQIMLRETYIRTPITGIVASKNMEAGEMIKDESVIGVIMDISKVFVTFNVSEKDLAQIKLDQKVIFTVDAVKGNKFTGTIKRITPLLDPQTRTIEIKALVNNKDNTLLPGMFARTEIQLGERKDVIMVPVSALIKKENKTGSVFLIKKNIIFRQAVKLGKEYNDNIEILDGLFANDIIITKGTSLVYEGAKVKL